MSSSLSLIVRSMAGTAALRRRITGDGSAAGGVVYSRGYVEQKAIAAGVGSRCLAVHLRSMTG